MKGILLLEDGSCFEGTSIGVPGERFGPVVLNTAVVGYQEMLTDSTNAGKILILTYPLIGNYGIAEKFYESRRCWTEALVIHEESRIHSNWQAESGLDAFLTRENLVTLSQVDTRTLAVQIRDRGEMLGLVSTETTDTANLLKKLVKYRESHKNSYIPAASVAKITEHHRSKSGPSIAVIDLGVSNSFVNQLKTLGCSITLLPFNTDAKTILDLKPDGVVISNGPEEDEAIPAIAATVREILGKKPLLGISTGHEVLCLALGAKLKKMKIGHHGVNYPVKPPSEYGGTITVQNHSLVVDEKSLPDNKDIQITLRNVDDDSIEEIESAPLKFISAQYYPAHPGFDETHALFGRFLDLVKKEKGM
ncbi:MAG: glutamine-hydrolyzing carbamoyl-phosphate synthase small subunit [bacterium]